jgi:hypothetical protein
MNNRNAKHILFGRWESVEEEGSKERVKGAECV